MPTTHHGSPEVIEMDLSTLIVCVDIQPRQGLTAATVAEYAELYRDGHDLGPITVFQDGDLRYVVDGFHRTAAAREADKPTLPAVVRPGNLRDAQLYAMGCNKHGQPYTTADKRHNVRRVLADPEWCMWSDRRIARHCGCTHPFVRKLRASLETVPSEDRPESAVRTYVNKYGQVATMHTAAIGQGAVDATTPPPLAWPEDPTQVRRWLTGHLKWLGYFEVIEFWGYFRESLTQNLPLEATPLLLDALQQQHVITQTPAGQYTYLPVVGEAMPPWHRWDHWPRQYRAPEGAATTEP